MIGQAFYGCLQRIPFHPFFKALHIKLTLNRRKQDYTKNVSVEFNTRRKKIKAESPDWRRAYICPSNRIAGQIRNRLGYRGTP